jgi:hypothetical protein
MLLAREPVTLISLTTLKHISQHKLQYPAISQIFHFIAIALFNDDVFLLASHGATALVLTRQQFFNYLNDKSFIRRHSLMISAIINI